LLSLEQSSLIDENAVVLTAHDSLINEGTTLFVTNPKEREKKGKEDTCPWRARRQGSYEDMH
jgi:hypothetical protein